MKMQILLFCLVFHFFGCAESNTPENSLGEIQKDSIIRPAHISTNATLINLGFIEEPSYSWVEYVGSYREGEKTYPHIHQFKYSDQFGGNADTLNYEWNESREREKELEINDFKDYTFIPFPGNGTIQIKKGKNEFILFNVLEFHYLDRVFRKTPYFRVPTVKTHSIHPEHGLVSDDDTEINVRRTEEGYYNVKLIDIKGIREVKFKKNEECKESTTKISYMNKVNGKIYFVQSGCYLELVNPKELNKI